MDTTVGYVLLGSAAVPGFFGYLSSTQGLRQVKQEAEKAEHVHMEATRALANAQQITARASGDPATELAAANKQVAETTGSLADAIGSVQEALKSMTGPFAPARVFLSLSFLLVIASLFPLGVLTISTS